VVDAVPGEPGGELAEKIRFDVPHSARIWNYWLGGKDNYPVDREAGEAVIAVYPQIVPLAQQSRQFLIRAIRFLANEAGVRQFLDVGTGLPTMQNTHEVAQQVASAARVVYVDNDPLVLAHARALLTNTTPEGVTAYVDADLHNPDLIISDARNLLNFNEPIAVIFGGVLGHVHDFDEARGIVTKLMGATTPGSHLVIYDSVSTSDGVVEAESAYADTGTVPYIVRTAEQVGQFFDGLDLVEPGLVAIPEWRPDRTDIGTLAPIDGRAAVGRKP
jgi:S-adenosyl methyltransferase